MKIQFVHTDQAPAAIGPYSQAVAANGILYLSGQLGINPQEGKIVAGGIANEVEQIFKNIQAVLKAGGTSLENVLKCTVYLTTFEHFATLNKIYEQNFQAHKPARTTIAVTALPMGALVEIDVLARLNS